MLKLDISVSNNFLFFCSNNFDKYRANFSLLLCEHSLNNKAEFGRHYLETRQQYLHLQTGGKIEYLWHNSCKVLSIKRFQ